MVTCKERQQGLFWTVGENKVGQANVVGEFLKKHHANVEACSAARLAHVFGMQTLFSANAEDMRIIKEAYINELTSLSPIFYRVAPHERERSVAVRRHDLVVFAYDEVGVVADLTAALAEENVDIAHLASCQYPAPEVGVPLFVVEMKVDVSRTTSMRSLRAVLHSFEAERGWDVEFTPERPSDASVPSRSFPPSREMFYEEVVADSDVMDVSQN